MNVSYVKQIKITKNAIERIESRLSDSPFEEDLVVLKALKAYLKLLLQARA